MRTILTTIFYLSILLAGVSVAALFVEQPQSQDYILALALVAFSACSYFGRRAYLLRFGRLGLLAPSLRWKPMTGEARKAALVISVAEAARAVLAENEGTNKFGIGYQIRKDIRKIKELGFARKSRSDEELISERKLYRFLELGVEDRSDPPLEELTGVLHTDVFFELRDRVDDWYDHRADIRESYQDWLSEVGETDQSHLLKDGWIPFLESLQGPDIYLWHGIATDFHEMFGDRLDAAFWILKQDECDRATASDFIVGFLQFELTAEYANISRPNNRLADFVSVVEAYNAGRYQAHSITSGAHLEIEFDDAAADEILTIYEQAQGLHDLPRPKGLISSTHAPSHDTSRAYTSGYAFWDDAGLHLEYPGPNWRRVA